MKWPAANNPGKANSLVSYFAMQRPKTLVAAGLIGLMVFMWVRVLTKKRAAAQAQAAPTSQAGILNADEWRKNHTKIQFIKLPEVKGRNDVLSRDFFADRRWERFTKDADGKNSNKTEEVNVVAKYGSENGRRKKAVLRLAEELTLDAVVLGRNTEAFIGNTLVSVGDKLQVEDKGELYEFDVVEISENEVVLMCEGVRLEIKMPAN